MSWRGRGLAVALLAGLLLAGLGWRSMQMFFSDDERSTLKAILGPAGAPLLHRADVAPFTPDANYKPARFYVVSTLARADFEVWARSAGLTLSEAPAVPAGVWVLPPDVQPKGWIDVAAAGPGVDALGSIGSSTVWSRWSEGRAHTVVFASY